MAFDVKSFVNTNKKLFIWTAFFGLLFLIRGLFGLVFLTFILCFIFNNLIKRLHGRFGLPRRLWTVLIYIVFVLVVASLISMVGPKLGAESTQFIKSLPKTLENIYDYLDKVAAQQPKLGPLMERAKAGLSIENLVGTDRATLVNIAVASFNQITHYFSYFLLGTLFSFFILFDFPRLRASSLALRETKLKEVYEETAESVVQFALVVGAAFQAQILIALVNTALTALGLWALGIHPISLLCVIVFVCGLIPVLGVFISSVPILLLAFNTDGFQLMGWALVMIIGVHSVEAYFLNPNIFSAIFKINPVLTLIILYIGHRLFGFWGVLLGVPISVYIYRYAILGHKNVVDHEKDLSEFAPEEPSKKESEA